MNIINYNELCSWQDMMNLVCTRRCNIARVFVDINVCYVKQTHEMSRLRHQRFGNGYNSPTVMVTLIRNRIRQLDLLFFYCVVEFRYNFRGTWNIKHKHHWINKQSEIKKTVSIPMFEKQNKVLVAVTSSSNKKKTEILLNRRTLRSMQPDKSCNGVKSESRRQILNHTEDKLMD